MKGTRVAVYSIYDLIGMVFPGCPQEFKTPHSKRVKLRMQVKWNDEEIKPIIWGKMGKRSG